MDYDTLEKLVGEHVLGYAPKLDLRHPCDPDATGCMFQFKDINRTFMVFEDPNDGYRSCAAPLVSYAGDPYQIGGEFRGPEHLGPEGLKVVCTMEGDGEGVLTMRDEHGQIVFEVGTDNLDGYYPSYTARWTPRQEGA